MNVIAKVLQIIESNNKRIEIKEGYGKVSQTHISISFFYVG